MSGIPVVFLKSDLTIDQLAAVQVKQPFASGYVAIDLCPDCGAPIYAPKVYLGQPPPPNHPTCGCALRRQLEAGEFDERIAAAVERSMGSMDGATMAKAIPQPGITVMLRLAELVGLLDTECVGQAAEIYDQRIRELVEDEDVQDWLKRMRELGLGHTDDRSTTPSI